MVITMSWEYEKSLIEFLYKYNNRKEYTVAWVPENYSEIVSYDKSSFILCIENNEIVGCLGAYVSKEQKIARLLGPIITKEYFEKYIEEAYEQFQSDLPDDIKELRIAFFMENELCKSWCDKKGFELYNAEKSIVYRKEIYVDEEIETSVELVAYEEKYKEGLSLVHPKETFYTLDELISNINNKHHLILSVDKDEVTGYIYYEITEDEKVGEIVLLHVREDKRGKGHGTILLKKAIKKLISTNVDEISTSVRVTNHGAQKLYERIGFVDKETVYAYKKYLG